MKHEEDNIQMACVKWFGLRYPQYAILLHHSPNGGYRNIREAARFKAMGTRSGFPDLFLSIPNKTHHGLYVEMKTPKGKQSPTQIEFQNNVEPMGYRYVVCRSLDSFIEIITDYFNE